MKKYLFTFFIAIVIGFFLSVFFIKQYDNYAGIKVYGIGEKLYFIQYGVFSSLESMENPEWLVSTEYDPEEYTMQNRRHRVLRDSIAKLRPIEQKVIEMHYYQEMGIREIGRRIGYSHSWIEKTHRAAMEQLKNMKIQEFIEK